MAAARILQSPPTTSAMDKMASQRAALRDLSNAANSPMRHASTKRSRADNQAVFEDVHGPPSKRQLLENDTSVQDRENIPPQPQTPQKKKIVSTLDARMARHQPQHPIVERERATRQVGRDRFRDNAVDIESREKQRTADSRQDDISRWQRYYAKQFPHFRFYFENLPDDSRKQCSKQVVNLGAKDSAFFDRTVTHVITTRQTPSDSAAIYDESRETAGEEEAHQSGTINPSLLDRRNKAIDELAGGRSKYNFDAAMNRKTGLAASPEKSGTGKGAARGDVLVKARAWGIKIWQLEKLQRILRVMYADEDANEVPERENIRVGRSRKQTNLSQLIKDEARHLTSTRELGTLQGEIITLTDPYIFIRCYNEKTKPLMVRQYQKVSDHRDGDWPQFRPVTQGKCPFIPEEPRHRPAEKAEAEGRRERETEKEERVEQRAARAQAEAEQPKRSAKRKHEEMVVERNEGLSPYEAPDQDDAVLQVLDDDAVAKRGNLPVEPRDIKDGFSKAPVALQQDGEEDSHDVAEDATTDAPQITPPLTTETTAYESKPEAGFFANHSRQTSLDLMAPPAALPRPNPRIGVPGGEPIASGLQKSGMTSAIRSQMISSNAGTTGIRAGTSKDLHSLQRRILERNSTGSGSTLGMSAPANAASACAASVSSRAGLVHSRGMLDIAGRARAENPRAAKTKAVEKLNAHGKADMAVEDDRDGNSRGGEPANRQRSKLKREPKPGYCENCREKFDDFEVHTKSRKHRRFALDKNNWQELDNLLLRLERPLKLPPVKATKRKRNDYETVEVYSEEAGSSSQELSVEDAGSVYAS